MAAAFARQLWFSTGALNATLTIAVNGGLFVWAIDEIVRGVNPWRRCLGTAVAVYETATFLLRAA